MTARKQHLVKVYLHLCAAIFFVLVAETALFANGTAQRFAPLVSGQNWIFLFAAFMVAGWIARHVADALGLFASVALMFWYALRWFRYSR